ncbi:MAG: GCN5-related N-acetyltransferase [Acidobacteria bacterium]|nr:GCN5-related N-acetyltransferase [Acidobacteriota bacterium]
MTQKFIPVIRQATNSDAALLIELGSRTFSETFAADNTAEDMADYLAAAFSPEQLAAELADGLATFLIAEIDQTAVGYAMLHAGALPHQSSGEKPIELVRLYVSSEWHGRQVGASLMQACIDLAQKRGYRTLWLGVWEHNGRARAFYRKWKFEEFGEHLFQLGGDPQNDILMARTLQSSDN